MEKLTLEHLAPYLPYGLKVLDKQDVDTREYNIEYVKDENTYTLSIGTLNGTLSKPFRYPILRPMSDVKSQIIHNGETVNLFYKLGLTTRDGLICDDYYAEYGESPKCYIPVDKFNWWLFEYHFDVFGLIEKGLAISIHDVK